MVVITSRICTQDDLQPGLLAMESLRNAHKNTKIVAIGLESAAEAQISSIADEDATIMVDSYANLLSEFIIDTAKSVICSPVSYSLLDVTTQPSRAITVTSAPDSTTDLCRCYWTSTYLKRLIIPGVRIPHVSVI